MKHLVLPVGLLAQPDETPQVSIAIIGYVQTNLAASMDTVRDLGSSPLLTVAACHGAAKAISFQKWIA